ncbi:MAG: DNA polymerase IV [Defluviitaleaceae bacterium]|nr:DNA polymerase IV [Defluviitaleaceae bacterium]
MKSNRVIFHIDVNSAYLAWEAVERLKDGETQDIRNIPSIVGGDPATRRGIVLSKSLPCKPYKIQTGESLYSALKKFPELAIIPARFGVYEKYSDNMMHYLGRFSDRVQQYSIDEAFIDYTFMEEHFGSPIEAADKIRNGIKEKFGFTVCVGVSSNKLLAKMATELRKPDYTNTLFPNEIEKMWALPIEELFMAGRATAPKLRRIGIETIGDLAKYDVKLLTPIFKSYANILWQYANGIDESIVETQHAPAKSIGNSITIPFDVTGFEDANRVLLHLCESVGKRLRRSNVAASVISVGIRNSSFQYYSRQMKIGTPTDSTTELYRYAVQIFKEGWRREPVRQLGVRAEKLSSGRVFQMTLLDDDDGREKQKILDRSIDAIRGRFGDESLMRASFLCREKKSEHILEKFSPFRDTGGL